MKNEMGLEGNSNDKQMQIHFTGLRVVIFKLNWMHILTHSVNTSLHIPFIVGSFSP